VRIAFVTETWLPSTDGVVTRMTATIRELRRSGHDVLVIAPEGGGADYLGATVRGVPTFAIRRVYGGKPWGLPLPRIGGYLREFQPDIVHVVNPMMMGIVAVIAARLARLPLVASYHTDVARYASYYRLGFLRPVIWWLLRRLHGRAEINLATSGATCAELREHRIPRVALWRRGVDLDLFRPGLPTPREPLLPMLSATRPITALYVGRIAAEKGLDRLAPLTTTADLRLLLVGDGPQRAELTDLFGDRTASFLGILHGQELAAEYANADVFVFPSTTDTLGLVLLEALASGLPIVAADSPASRELLADCPAARLFPATESERLPKLVAELAADPAAGRLARAEAEQWGWPAATSHLLEHYRTAFTRHRGPTRGRIRQLAAFSTIGGLNALVDVLAFNILLLAAPTQSSWMLTAYNTIAVCAALTNSYLLNSRWTFRATRARHRSARWRQRVGFLAQAAVNIVVNDLVLSAMAGLFAGVTFLPGWLDTNLAKVTAMLCASFVSFVLLRTVVFSERVAGRPWTDSIDDLDIADVTELAAQPAQPAQSLARPPVSRWRPPPARPSRRAS
jgi:glycosyltransferase involved in cell wall biosynthesis/putative flippase GtrA